MSVLRGTGRRLVSERLLASVGVTLLLCTLLQIGGFVSVNLQRFCPHTKLLDIVTQMSPIGNESKCGRFRTLWAF